MIPISAFLAATSSSEKSSCWGNDCAFIWGDGGGGSRLLFWNTGEPGEDEYEEEVSEYAGEFIVGLWGLWGLLLGDSRVVGSLGSWVLGFLLSLGVCNRGGFCYLMFVTLASF
jgi:hypothetical protein